MTNKPQVPAPEFSSRWMRDGLCAEAPGLPWTEHRAVPRESVDLMRYLCQHCPVNIECTVFTRDADVNAGFWGGASRNPLANSEAIA